MAQTPRYLSATNGFIPQATDQVIGYIRNPARFKMNQYCQWVRSEQPIGVYTLIDRDEPVRVVSDGAYAWEDGDDFPEGNDNDLLFEMLEFRCFRRAIAYQVGDQIVGHTKVMPVLAARRQMAATKAMTLKTWRIITLLETVANWPAYNTADANALNGNSGKWTLASNDPNNPAYLAITKTLLQALYRIVLQTNGEVTVTDLRLVISPGAAIAIGQSAEMVDYLKSTAGVSLSVIEGKIAGSGEQWRLPKYYCGFEIVVEDAVRVTNRANMTTQAAGDDTVGFATPDSTRVFIKSNNSAIIASRAGGINGVYGAPSFSTVQVYFHQYDMLVKEEHDAFNEKHRGGVVDQYKEVLAAKVSGMLITNIL